MPKSTQMVVKQLALDCVPRNAYGQFDQQDYHDAVKVCGWLIPLLRRRRSMAFISLKTYEESLTTTAPMRRETPNA